MIIQKHVKRMLICFARDRVRVISIVRHFCCGSGVYCTDCSRVSYVQLINQCGLYVDKIKIFKKISGCGLYTGALNRPKITVDACRNKSEGEGQRKEDWHWQIWKWNHYTHAKQEQWHTHRQSTGTSTPPRLPPTLTPSTFPVPTHKHNQTTTGTSMQPVNHCSQSIAFSALNRKARGTCRKACGTRRDRKTASQAELASRGITQHKKCCHIITDGRKKNEGLIIVVLASADQMNEV